ncbi:MAG TPA: hypothetical protein VF783_08210 [Terriglobales bacterium]
MGHPDHIADVLVVNAQSYTKSNMLRMLLGNGLATSEGRALAAATEFIAAGIWSRAAAGIRSYHHPPH